MKLKTLKDIKAKFTIDTDLVATDTLKEQLRQEAIKWIKELDKHTLEGFQITNVPYECCESATIITWIKHFFNITDFVTEEKWAKKIKKK